MRSSLSGFRGSTIPTCRPPLLSANDSPPHMQLPPRAWRRYMSCAHGISLLMPNCSTCSNSRKKRLGSRIEIGNMAFSSNKDYSSKELRLIQDHLEVLQTEMSAIVNNCREGQRLLSLPPIGGIQAATIIATVGNIANFEKASELKAYFGWAPKRNQTGTSFDRTTLSKRGVRPMKQMLFLMAVRATMVNGQRFTSACSRAWQPTMSAPRTLVENSK